MQGGACRDGDACTDRTDIVGTFNEPAAKVYRGAGWIVEFDEFVACAIWSTSAEFANDDVI